MRKYTINATKKQNNPAVYYAIIIVAALAVVLLSHEDQPPVIPPEHTEPEKIEWSMTIAAYEPPQYEAITQDTTAIDTFVNNYPGSRLAGEYLELLKAECNGDTQLLKQLVAIATAETAQGRETPLENNFWGWHLNGNAWHDPDRETMAKQITQGIAAYYSGVGDDYTVADIYTGGDSTSTWLSIYEWAMNEMAD